MFEAVLGAAAFAGAAAAGIADAESEMRQGRSSSGGTTIHLPDELSLKDRDHKRIKQSVSEAISENIKDFYINISGKVLINSSKIVSVSAEYKRYNTYWDLEKDGLTEIAELARDVHYFETEDEEAKNFTLQNIRITIQTVAGTPFIYDSLLLC